MGYSAIKTPRFYIDIPQWLNANRYRREIEYYIGHSPATDYSPFYDHIDPGLGDDGSPGENNNADAYMIYEDLKNINFGETRASDVGGIAGLNPSSPYYITGRALKAYLRPISMPQHFGNANYWDGLTGQVLRGKTRLKCLFPLKESFFNSGSNKYVAFLGHNFANSALQYIDFNWSRTYQDSLNPLGSQIILPEEVLNYEFGNRRVPFDGSTIVTFDDTMPQDHDFLHISIENKGASWNRDHYFYPLQLGAMSVGSWYEMPKNPTLNVELSFEFEEDRRRTYNGSELTNRMWNSKARWGMFAPWEIHYGGRGGGDPFNQNAQKLVSTSQGYREFIQSQQFKFLRQDYIDRINGENPITRDEFERKYSNIAAMSQYYQGEEQIMVTDENNIDAGLTYSKTSTHYSSNIYDPLSVPGRRVWKISFTYLDTEDVFGPNQSVSFVGNNLTTGWNQYNEGDIVSGQEFVTNVHNDNNFFSQVWNKTLGGHLPFIFQPDNTYNLPSGFAICKIDAKTLKIKRSHYNAYDISFTVKEVW